MKFNEEDLQSNVMDLIQEREKYRMLALKYKEALEKIKSVVKDRYVWSVADNALKAGGEDRGALIVFQRGAACKGR